MRTLIGFKRVVFAAVAAMGMAAVGEPAVTITQEHRDVDNNVVSLDVSLEGLEEGLTHTLYMAYGTTDGGDTTNGWDVVKRVAHVFAGETTKTVDAPDGLGKNYLFVRFFLAEGLEPAFTTLHEYVKGNGSYVNTAFVPNQDTRAVGEFYVTGSGEYWFGCWGSGYNSRAFAIRGSGGVVYNGYDGQGGDRSWNRSLVANTRQLVDMDKNVTRLTILDGDHKDEIQYEQNWTYQTFSAGQPLYLLAFNQSGSCNGGGNIQCYWFQVYDNGTLVRDFLPATYNGQTGCYDALSDTFYPTVGGTVTMGDEVDGSRFVTVGEVIASSPTRTYRQCTVTAVVNPAKAGVIKVGALQIVDAGVAPAPITVIRSSKDCDFVGWRVVGTDAVLSRDQTFQPPAPMDNVAYEAVFTVPEYDWIYAARYDSTAEVTGVCDGLSWAAAFTNLTEAMEMASIFKGEVWIKGGTHVIPGSGGVSLSEGIVLRGGFEGADGKTPEQELAARDVVAHETILKGSYVFYQHNSALASTVDGVTFAGCGNYAFYCPRADDCKNVNPTFTNCCFRGNAPVFVASDGSGAVFRDCRFSAMTGGSYGRLFFEPSTGGREVLFASCLFENTTQADWSVCNFSGSSSGRFTDCLFTNNVITSYGNQDYAGAAIAGRGSSPTFERCRILWNKSLNGGSITRFGKLIDCIVASNTVKHTTSTSHAYLLLASSGAKMQRTAIFDNEIIREHPTLTAGSVASSLIAIGGHQFSGGASTIANNRFMATLGEGATATFETVAWSGAYYGGFANCTFLNNDVTAEISEGQKGGRDAEITLYNNIFWNAKDDYVALRSLYTKDETTHGFWAYDNVIKGFDRLVESGKANLNESEGNTGDDPLLAKKAKVAANGAVYYPIAKGGSAVGPTVEVQVGDNAVMIAKGMSGNRYQKWNSDAGPTNPKSLKDIVGNDLPVNRKGETITIRGASYDLRPSGIALIVR